MLRLGRLCRASSSLLGAPSSLCPRSPLISSSVQSRTSSGKTESFLSGTSAAYEEQMYESWKRDPSSVHASWNAYFTAIDAGLPAESAHSVPYNLGMNQNIKVPIGTAVGAAPAAAPAAAASAWDIDASLRLFSLVRAFWRNGHIQADLDPLNRRKEENLQPRFVPLDLSPEYWGFTEEDMDRKIPIGGRPPLLSMTGKSHTTVREVLDELKKAYCGKVAIEFTHVNNHDMVKFLRERMEAPFEEPGKEERMMILDRLAWGDLFENFLATKYGGAKRFGLEGCESLIPGVKALIDTAADHGCEEMLIGMPHRGRLNTLANIIRKPLPAIFCEFKGQNPLEEGSGTGDVKYHLGTSYVRHTNAGKKIRLSLAANPSHLEAVNPVVCGRTRARQDARGDNTGRAVCALLMHGDAAFAGQGVVYESLHLNDLPKYTTRGSIHIVVNNQIGFTTDPRDARSTPHPTDVAKNVNAPIVHVNADDVESVVRVFKMAAEFRQTFQEDFVIDLVGYRRHGHNEIDPCEMTQPLMYKLIGKHAPVLKQYENFLLEKNVCSAEEIKGVKDRIKQKLESGFEEAKSYKTKDKEWLESRWSNYKRLWEKTGGKPRPTNIDADRINKIGASLTALPEGFTPHKQIKKVLEKKKEMFASGKGFDWGTAEALAFGSLVQEGVKVRLSGQDSERGTFSHRHAVLHDQKTGEKFTPLHGIQNDVGRDFDVSNSSLSEFGVMGFDLGYSLEDPDYLVLWEGQFGDFSNGAQIIIDQFISSGEQKWNRQSGLVLLLPHGYDGQGPEHSSARLERFLAMTDSPIEVAKLDSLEARQRYVQEANWQVCNVTNPANYYHLLRRQIHRPFRKPLCLMSPKNLLRHPLCVSSLEEFTETELFTRVYPETFPEEINAPKDVKKVIFCSGKIYYELLEQRRASGIKDIAIARVEQLAPFPHDLVKGVLEEYPDSEVVWCQEEPENMGAWHYLFFQMRAVMESSSCKATEPTYVGRVPAASPATGLNAVHVKEQKAILDEALS